MRENWLEEGLRDKFEGFDSEMNLEEAWVGLEQKRNEPNKRRLGWLWIVTGSMLFLGSALTIYQLSTNDTIDIADAKLKTEVSNNITEQEVKTTVRKSSISEDPTQIDLLTESHSNEISLTQQLENTNQNRQTTIISRLVNNTPANYLTAKQQNQIIQNKLTTSGQAIDQHTSSTVRQSATVSSTNLAINQITFLEGVTSTLQRDSKQVFNFKFADFSIEDRAKKSKSIPQFVGIDFGFSPVTSGQILADEEALDAISANLFYKKYLSTRFYLKAGVGVDRYMTRQAGSTVSTFTSIEPNQVVSRVIYENGTIENILGDGEVTTTETTAFQLYNTYQFVSIPVVAGFRIVDRDHTNIELEGGMSTTFSSQYDVKEYDPTNGGQVNQLADLNLRNTNIFSGVLAVQWNYHPKSLKRLGVFVKAGSRFQVNDISTGDRFNIEKFRSYQLGLGLQYRL